MLKDRIAGLCLSVLVLAGICAGAAAPLSARAEEEATPETPQEPVPEQPTDGATALTTENAELFLPESYEQYLPLEKPACMAMSASYLAVADGQTLYIYDRAAGVYSAFHAPLQEEEDKITKVQFSDDGRLFFSASGLFYEYSFETGEATENQATTCATFLVVKDSLYTVRPGEGTMTLCHYYLSDISREGETRLVPWNSSITPRLSFQDDRLYVVQENSIIRTYDISTPNRAQSVGNPVDLDELYNGAPITGFQFACAYGDSLYYTVNGTVQSANGLYRTDFRGNAERLFAGNGFADINSYNGNLYCIRGASVLGLSVTDEGVSYSGYEIASSSSSENRLANATCTVRRGDLLVTADSGNNRVSVYEFSEQRYSVIDCGFTPLHVATDGGTIAVASDTDIYVSYPDERGKFTTSFEKAAISASVTGATINGLTCIFGKIYFVLGGDFFGLVGDDNIRSSRLGETISGITSDLYGTIYVATKSGNAYSYLESDFLRDGAAGKQLGFRLPADFLSLRSDFEGNLYCVSENVLYRNGEPFAAPARGFVYEENAPLRSFALGFENSEVYLLFGDYVVKSRADALDIPTLDKIAIQGAAQACFSDHAPAGILTDVPEHVIGIQTSLAELRERSDEDNAYFPYKTYFRTEEKSRGVLLAETDRYALVLLEDKEEKQNRGYKAALFRLEVLEEANGYYEEETRGAYLSSAVYSYYVPALCSELAGVRMTRGAYVSVEGYVHTPSRDYARISYRTEERAAAYGYVPATFLTEVNPLSSNLTSFTTGYVKKNGDGILFTAEDGETLTLTERTRAKLYAEENGYLAEIEAEGKAYTAHVGEGDVDWGTSGALRIALIIILTVLALVIIGAYVYLLPRKRTAAPAKEKKKPTKSP